MMSAPMVYIEIAGPDGGALKKFYETVFGWSIASQKKPGYGWAQGPGQQPDGTGESLTGDDREVLC